MSFRQPKEGNLKKKEFQKKSVLKFSEFWIRKCCCHFLLKIVNFIKRSYAQIVVSNGNSKILDNEGHSSKEFFCCNFFAHSKLRMQIAGSFWAWVEKVIRQCFKVQLVQK